MFNFSGTYPTTPLARNVQYVITLGLGASYYTLLVLLQTQYTQVRAFLGVVLQLPYHTGRTHGCNLYIVITFRFLLSTSYVFRLGDNAQANHVADIRLFRPPSSGAA